MPMNTVEDLKVNKAEISYRNENKRAIFIVGVSRSGTTLMRNILNESSQVAISRENHFLGHLIGAAGMRHTLKRFGDLKIDSNVCKMVDYIYSGEMEKTGKLRRASAHWRWITRRVPKEVFLNKILQTSRTENDLFTVMMECFAERKGKPIMGEKTPAHLRYVPLLLEWFPNAKIIHMVRDPRGIYVSEFRRRLKEATSFPYRQLVRIPFLLKLYILGQITFSWGESYRCYREFRRRFPERYYPMRFEDLVSHPHEEIPHLCRFLDIPFENQMLDQTVVSMGYQQGQQGFDSQAASRWSKHIDPWARSWFQRIFKQGIQALGYELPGK